MSSVRPSKRRLPTRYAACCRTNRRRGVVASVGRKEGRMTPQTPPQTFFGVGPKYLLTWTKNQAIVVLGERNGDADWLQMDTELDQDRGSQTAAWGDGQDQYPPSVQRHPVQRAASRWDAGAGGLLQGYRRCGPRAVRQD